jgi:hypothetical protein
MTIPPSEQAQWKAPAADGEILIWPEPRSLVSSVRENQKLLSDAGPIRIANIPLPELRRSLRHWIGHSDDAQPIVAMGHQIELYHPGVWAKNVLIHELAGATGGQAYHVAVETDAPKHLHLRWPGASLPITDDPRLARADWAGLLQAPTPQHLSRLASAFDAASRGWGFEPLVEPFLSALRRLSLESPALTPSLTNAIHEVEWQVGLRHHTLLASPLWGSHAYLAFVHHILANATSFAGAYNTALADYRRENDISNVGRPWPDLRVTADECEVPFWIDSLERETRTRGRVVPRDGGFTLAAGGSEPFAFDPRADGHAASDRLARFLTENTLRLSPRALTLTCFLRLFLADQFVHGIGGARYDQITDRVIEKWIGLRPPAYSVTTATLLFPGALGVERVDVDALSLEGRRLRHGDGLPRKAELVRRIASLPRGSVERSRLYYEMHSMLGALENQPPYQRWQQRYESAREQARHEEMVSDRELFFAIQPAERLTELVEKYHVAVARGAGA